MAGSAWADNYNSPIDCCRQAWNVVIKYSENDLYNRSHSSKWIDVASGYVVEYVLETCNAMCSSLEQLLYAIKAVSLG